jgi:bacillithiol system protein YtxJ
MHWIHLTDEDQLQKIIVRSQEKPQVIFKYNPGLHLSELILQRFQKKCCPEHIDFHFLEVMVHASISEKLSKTFKVANHSPQILLIKDGECIFQDNGTKASFEDIMEHAAATA